jgi:site-specific DNA recombinase
MKHSVFNELEAFSVFAKGQIVKKEKNTNSVIYTRVSSKEQTKGMSLEIQKKECEQYALRNKIPIMGYFGGTYESAKTDERKEFNRMLAFVKKSREKISIIIVYSIDRFSRSGANAVYIADQLKQQGISVFAVTQPTDTTTPNGCFQQKYPVYLF